MNKWILGIVFMAICTVFAKAQDNKEEILSIYKERIAKERINDVYIPKDIPDAMLELDKLTENKMALGLLEANEDTVASKLHFSLGRWMQIHWGLGEGSRLMEHLKSKGLSFPDDMMDLLIRSWYRHLNGQVISEDALIQGYVQKRKKEHLERLRKSKPQSFEKPPKQEHRE
ncbi:MAG: hypothetical protein IPM92_05320 [Saprospiraceae bacterium]|nr:hypothetical protein [Saprospiraceae bacterium]